MGIDNGTHYGGFKSRKRVLYPGIDSPVPPTSPEQGEFYYDNVNNRMWVFSGTGWYFANFSTTTSSSTSTTSTTTSTTSTTSSTSSSSSTSTSTSSSTTTTL